MTLKEKNESFDYAFFVYIKFQIKTVNYSKDIIETITLF